MSTIVASKSPKLLELK